MSFILDALRKSEHARQRQSGPGLAEVAVAAPRTRTSLWATAAVVLLVANLVAVGVLMLRRAKSSDAPEPATVAVAAPSRAAPPPAAAAPAQPAAAPIVPPMLQPADPRSSAGANRNPLEDEIAGDSIPPDPVLAERSASVPAGPPAVTEYRTRPGSVIYEPLASDGSQAPEGAPALPTIDDLGSVPGGLPEMHVDLHVYAANPQDRFVFVNKRKYREGETLQEGPRIEEITRDGVVLNQQGRRFILPRQ